MAKGWPFNIRRLLAGGTALALIAGATITGAAAALRARDVWCDPQTGVAIGGFDPVAYYVAHAPRQGSAAHETVVDGIAWQFASDGNRAAFEHDPEVYAPRFGGRDPWQLARGFAAEGNPLYWLIDDGRLLLFAAPRNRIRWLSAPAATKAKAEANWPALVEATQ